MMQDKGKDLDHLLVTARPLEQPSLQVPEGLGHLQKRRAIAQSTGLSGFPCAAGRLIIRPPWL
jgi:hypothetical protein